MSLNKEEIKAIRDELKLIAKDIKDNYKEFEETLKSKKVDYFHTEFYKHGQELITLLTDDKIDELFS